MMPEMGIGDEYDHVTMAIEKRHIFKEELDTGHEEFDQTRHSWCRDEIEQLIEMYRQRSCLWDIYDRFYKERDAKQQAWQEMSEVLGVTVTEVQAKVKTLRAQFGRENVKIQKNMSINGGQPVDSKWMFWKRLTFLQRVTRQQKPKSDKTKIIVKFSDSALADYEASGAVPLHSNMHNIDIHHNSSSSDDNLPLTALQKRNYEDTVNDDEPLKKKMIPTSSSGGQQGASHFAMYITERLDKLGKKSRLMAEKQINDVLFKLEFEDLDAGESSDKNSASA